ncbi:MAG: hypothetical protein MK082_11065 [Phycisphaerales bacterium]|nr:hypothetical protein [Phycisphaerales bacterium]
MTPTPEPRQKTRPDGPRRVRNGLKLRRKEEETEWQWPAGTWAETLLQNVPNGVMKLALEYGRLGQTTMLETGAGLVTANVQCEPARPFQVRIEFPQLSEIAWGRVLQRTASEAIYAAKLLAGEFPSIVEEPFKEAGHPLFPNITEVNSSCSCPSDTLCHHQVVVALLLLERLQETPELVIALRGRTAERFRNDLQEARMLATRGVSQAHTNPDIVSLAGSVRSLESRVDEFWRPSSSIDLFRAEAPKNFAKHALLRRLGASPIEGRFPITGLLASIYDTISEETARIRSAAEGPAESTGDDETDQAPSGTGGEEPYSSS